MIRTSTHTITSTATLVASRLESDTTPGRDVALRNTGATVTVYLGGPNVTANNGYPLPPNTQLLLTTCLDNIHAATAMGSGTLAVLEAGV